jgi:hypothetical protein
MVQITVSGTMLNNRLAKPSSTVQITLIGATLPPGFAGNISSSFGGYRLFTPMATPFNAQLGY